MMRFSEWLVEAEAPHEFQQFKSEKPVYLYRGMAGQYQKGYKGRHADIQHFTGDIGYAVRYAKNEAARPENVAKGLKPTIYVIKVNSGVLQYRTVGGADEIYDIPVSVADKLQIQEIPFAQAEKMAATQSTTLQASGKNMTPVIFKGQGPSPNGWAVKLSAMGAPKEVQSIIAKSIRDVQPNTIKHPALSQRIQRLGEIPAIIISDIGTFITTMPTKAMQVAKQQVEIGPALA